MGDKLLRRLQIILTILVLLPSAGLLMFAYFSATTPGHSTAETLLLAIAGVALAPANYALWGFIRQMRRAQEPGADPRALATRLGRYKYLGVIPAALSILIVQVVTAHPAHDTYNAADNIRSSCITGTASALKERGTDPTAASVKASLTGYCGCIVANIERSFTPAEVERIDKSPADDPKIKQIAQTCSTVWFQQH
jgi:hypothetical protein